MEKGIAGIPWVLGGIMGMETKMLQGMGLDGHVN